MTSFVDESALGLAASVVLLVMFIFLSRLLADRRRRRERELRERFELALGEYLSDEGADPPPARGEQERRALRAVALDALVELRGRERERVTEALERTGIVGDALRELREGRPILRRRAADALAQIRSPSAAPALAEGLGDPDRGVALACARGLAELGDESFVPLLVPAAEAVADEFPAGAAEVLLALGANMPAGIERAFAATRSPEVRRLVAAVVGELRLADLAPLLRGALHDDDDELVARAARGLGSIGDADSAEALRDLLEDDERPLYVRTAAARALGEIGDASAVPAIERALSADSWALRENAARALALLGPPGQDALRRAAAVDGGVRAAQARVALEA